MNFKLSTIAKVIIPLCSVVAVVGCNDSSSSDAKASPETGGGYFDTTNAPKINIVLPETDGAAAKLPVSGPVDEPVKADSDEAVIYYVMKDGNVDAAANYDLYIWNDETCDRADKSVTHGWETKRINQQARINLGLIGDCQLKQVRQTVLTLF
ncbi:hypothetical protein [Photobacterium sp. J15]|uniref:hypothetical protein n=1 Tax=Photobacterium sp. J15 TaxID=265901 RepID=UPI000A523AB4|nr:hypothetical protein [Photobacterium sp. J15]